ncbi:hypothetical protein L593_03390 [Salinarchaeum sp. Harcht-Bsk1]|uniref:stage II sporulation protein M n=1 Tax=Salinarchaeum sp. Harcht-Bsk1 TaxID=1333523 RepID=UPI0003423677|nr:stage II sporulation protein M [Salinarchaeum sp. Harcht-Bsk1]AGN00629.1 hypothetical protein L593_03390 [Salinarchaeum sp. Harcht-Bsk1]
MSLDDAVRDSVRAFGARPAKVLPFYVAGLAVPVITRVVPVVGLFLAYLSLRGSGRIEAVRDELEGESPIGFEDPGTTDVDEEALGEALLDLLTPTVIAILLVTTLLAIVLFAVMQAAVSAGRLHAVYAVLSDGDATEAGVDGVFADTWTFLGLAIVELLAYLFLFGIPTALVAVAVGLDLVLLALPAIPLFLLAAVASLGVRLLFAFARPAIVVDDAGVVAGIRGALGYVRRNLTVAIGYGTLTIGLLVAANVVSGAFSQLGAVTVTTLLPLVFVFPLVDLVKTRLYADDAEVDLSPPTSPEADRLPRLRAGFARGWSALWTFTRGHLGLVGVSTVVLLAGVWVGLWAGAQVDDLFAASIEARLDRQGPVGAFFNYAANNWSVAAGQSLSGLVFGLPTIVSLAFNGANVGFLYQLEVEPEILVAFVLPHGIVEVPALLLSGALGLHLGRLGWGYVFGSVSRERLADDIDRGFQVLVGLAILFVLAAVIEAFVSPYYWRLLGI